MALVREAGRERDLGNGQRRGPKSVLDVINAELPHEFAHGAPVVRAEGGSKIRTTHLELLGQRVEAQAVTIVLSQDILTTHYALWRRGVPT